MTGTALLTLQYLGRRSQSFVHLTQQRIKHPPIGLATDISVPYAARYLAMRSANGNGLAARVDNTGSIALFRAGTQSLYTGRFGGLSVKSIPTGPGSYILRGDYDGDALEDIAVFYGGLWVLFYGNNGLNVLSWGTFGDLPVSGDFDGDGLTDIGVYREDAQTLLSTWFIIKSSDGSLLSSATAC